MEHPCSLKPSYAFLQCFSMKFSSTTNNNESTISWEVWGEWEWFCKSGTFNFSAVPNNALLNLSLICSIFTALNVWGRKLTTKEPTIHWGGGGGNGVKVVPFFVPSAIYTWRAPVSPSFCRFICYWILIPIPTMHHLLIWDSLLGQIKEIKIS